MCYSSPLGLFIAMIMDLAFPMFSFRPAPISGTASYSSLLGFVFPLQMGLSSIEEVLSALGPSYFSFVLSVVFGLPMVGYRRVALLFPCCLALSCPCALCGCGPDRIVLFRLQCGCREVPIASCWGR